jgi:hypothetical protein
MEEVSLSRRVGVAAQLNLSSAPRELKRSADVQQLLVTVHKPNGVATRARGSRDEHDRFARSTSETNLAAEGRDRIDVATMVMGLD